MNIKYIVIEGNIGAGKTSLARKLAGDLGAGLVLEEFAENTFLPQFYENPDKYAFPLEMSFLAARYQQLTELIDKQSNKLLVGDYLFEKSLLFAKVNLGKGELGLYQSIFNILTASIPRPDLVVYLHKHTSQLLENIQKRGRSYEHDIAPEYLESIGNAYMKLLEKTPPENLLEIDSGKLDFVSNDDDYKLIISKIKAKL